MGINKLQRFREITQFQNVLERSDYQEPGSKKPKGRWHADIFQNRCPITLELGCGKGRYTVELARRNQSQNYIGIDIKGARLWKGAQKARQENLENVRFLRIYIDHLDEYFALEEVDEIWITFPDPYPKGGDRDKRLTSKKFLRLYEKVLKKGGIIHFKTDSQSLFDFTRGSLEEFGCNVHQDTENIYKEYPENELMTIQTDFEKRHLKQGKPIKYIRFTLPD